MNDDDYFLWEAALLAMQPPKKHNNIDDLMKEIGGTNADGSWESLFERYTRKAQRSAARGKRRK